MELIISMGIFSLLIIGISNVFIVSLQNNNIIWEQLSGQHDARRAVLDVSNTLRKAESSSIGSYPLFSVGEYEIMFFANVDKDSLREKVRYWIVDEVLYRGVIKPDGSPLSYDPQNEMSTILAEDVQNVIQGLPLFEYYDETYTVTSTPISLPVDITDVRMVHIQLEISDTSTEHVNSLFVETFVHVRNLKDN